MKWKAWRHCGHARTSRTTYIMPGGRFAGREECLICRRARARAARLTSDTPGDARPKQPKREANGRYIPGGMREQVIALRQAGLSMGAIGRQLGLAPTTVRDHLVRAGMCTKGLWVGGRGVATELAVTFRRCMVCGGKEKVDEPHQHAA